MFPEKKKKKNMFPKSCLRRTFVIYGYVEAFPLFGDILADMVAAKSHIFSDVLGKVFSKVRNKQVR